MSKLYNKTMIASMNIKEQRMEAYKEAAIIDTAISALLDKYPPEKNPLFWLSFCRTVKSGIDIIDTISTETLKKEVRFD